MLVFTRKVGDKIFITQANGNIIVIEVLDVIKNKVHISKVRLGIKTDKQIKIDRNVKNLNLMAVSSEITTSKESIKCRR